ncbi:MAG: hypothetical protein GKR90_19885 [Pseudomonadales bacterium]|nr:hypothetical protein [Pseudomonadales bacterium]
MTVQFKSPVSTGSIEGILDIDFDYLTVEFEEPRFLRKHRTAQVRIPLDDIDFIRYVGLPFRARLELRALYLESLQRLPWAKALTANFIVPRAERSRAIELANRFDDYIHEDVEPESGNNI